MPRKSANVEFINKLRDISNYETVTAFAEACKKNVSDMSCYLSGTKIPEKRVLKSCMENLYGWQVRPLMEIAPIPENLNTLPTDAGVYVLYDSGAQVLYVGKATNFRQEVRQTLGRQIPVGLRFGPKLKKKRHRIKDLAQHLSLYAIESPRLRHNFEVLLLRGFANQTHNSNIGNFQ